MVDQTQEINKLDKWILLGASPNATAPQQLPEDMTFHEGHVVSIVTYSILMVVSGLANLTVLGLILKRRRRSWDRRTSSMMNPMLMHLAIADLLVTFLMMPLEIGWNVTVSWKAGDAMCRIMAFFRIFGVYLSGFVLMCISMDRYYAVLKPLSISQIKRRGRLMLGAAWAASTICSAPQIVIFHVEAHPNFTDYEQCVTFNFFKSKYHDLAYKYFGLVMMYGLPLFVIVFCYSSILCELYKKYRDCSNGSDTFRRPSAGFLGRARIRTLKMTITIVTGFIVCWTPYYVMCLWYWMDQESAQKVDKRIQKALFIFATGNSVLNPIFYGIFNVRTSPAREQNVIQKSTRSTRLSAIPDVVNGNQDVTTIAPKSTWRLQWQRSFCSDRHDADDANLSGEEKTVVKKRRFQWRLQSQRSFSSEGTDIADPHPVKIGGGNVGGAPNAEVKRYKWRQKPQRSSLSDGPDFPYSQAKGSGWRSWLSHHRVERLSSDEDLNMVETVPPKSTSSTRPSMWREWVARPKNAEKGHTVPVTTIADNTADSIT